MQLSKAENYSRQDFVETVHFRLGTEAVFGDRAFEAADEIIHFYESQKAYDSSSHRYLQLYTQLISDITFNIPAIREAHMKAASGHKVYFYVYNFVPEKMKHKLIDGAAHASELINLFGAVFNLPELPLEGEIAKTQKTMVDLFVNFAKNG